VETYPEQDIDAVLVHKVNAAREIVDMGLYEDASLSDLKARIPAFTPGVKPT
jgi:hypothetical protein